MEMSRPIIFLGPSLSLQKAREILPEADYRPPVKKGDLLKISISVNRKMVVGIIDGYFLLDYPPPPIEVYHLLIKDSVTVIGGSSLGALRAVELEKFGMIGIGKIFQLYKTKKLFADDEVAVTFSEDNTLQSEAMIDIRYNLARAFRKGIIKNETKEILAKISKNLYFPYRRYPDIIELASRRYPEKHSEFLYFVEFLRNSKRSLKEIDAIKVLKFIRENKKT